MFISNNCKIKNFLLSLVILLFSIILSCDFNDDKEIDGGPCTYNEIPGTATIISINNASSSSNNCNNDPVEVIFNFSPNNPADAVIEIDNDQPLTVGEGKNPPRDYITNKGITVGSTHECNRQDITSGTCTPYGFDFINIDLLDYAESCF